MPAQPRISATPVIIGGLALLLIAAAAFHLAHAPEHTKAGAKPLYPGEPVSGEPIRTASGLIYYDLKVGDGRSPARTVSRVRVHYTGYLLDGTKFDSSHDHGRPLEEPLSTLIPGWGEGMKDMKVGGKRKLIIPPQLGYKNQRQGKIPPNSTLVFDVELLAVVD